MKNMPADKKVKEFINYVKSIINEYSKYNKLKLYLLSQKTKPPHTI